MRLPLSELAAIVQARSALAKHVKSINDAGRFYLDHLERIRRRNITVAQLATEVPRHQTKFAERQHFGPTGISALSVPTLFPVAFSRAM